MLKFSGGAIVSGVPRAVSVTNDDQLPSKVDVVIIGGGLVGCITALNLAERGMSVAVCEKGVIAGEASGRAVAFVEYELLSSIKMELIARSIELWRAMPARIGRDIGFNDKGLATLYADKEQAEITASWLESMKGQPGIEARMLSAAEIAELDPAFGSGWASGLFQTNGASLEPRLAAPAIAEAAREKGVKILQGCAVRDIERAAGKIAGVVTEKGEIKAPNVLISSGVWSPMLTQLLGLELPQLMIFSELLSIEPVSGGPKIDGMTPAGYFRREPDGGYSFNAADGAIPVTPTIIKHLRALMAMEMDVDQDMRPVLSVSTFLRELRGAKSKSPHKRSTFEKHRILQPELSGRAAKDVAENMGQYIPAFRDGRVREHSSGALMASIDNLGVISAVASIPGLFIGSGMLYGVTMAAATGEALADMIMGKEPEVDVTPYRYERFIDGSPIKFHP